MVGLVARRDFDKVLPELDLKMLLGLARAFFYYAFYVGNGGAVRDDGAISRSLYEQKSGVLSVLAGKRPLACELLGFDIGLEVETDGPDQNQVGGILEIWAE